MNYTEIFTAALTVPASNAVAHLNYEDAYCVPGDRSVCIVNATDYSPIWARMLTRRQVENVVDFEEIDDAWQEAIETVSLQVTDMGSPEGSKWILTERDGCVFVEADDFED